MYKNAKHRSGEKSTFVLGTEKGHPWKMQVYTVFVQTTRWPDEPLIGWVQTGVAHKPISHASLLVWDKPATIARHPMEYMHTLTPQNHPNVGKYGSPMECLG